MRQVVRCPNSPAVAASVRRVRRRFATAPGIERISSPVKRNVLLAGAGVVVVGAGYTYWTGRLPWVMTVVPPPTPAGRCVPFEEETDAITRALFNELDTEDRGYFTPIDLATCGVLDYELSVDAATSAIRLVDTNNDGRVVHQELTNFMRTFVSVRELFNVCDIDRNGAISAVELERLTKYVGSHMGTNLGKRLDDLARDQAAAGLDLRFDDVAVLLLSGLQKATKPWTPEGVRLWENLLQHARSLPPEKIERTPPLAEKLVLTAISAAVAESVTFPIDLTKTRMQLQGEHLKALRNVEAVNIFGMVSRMARDEGLLGFYNGVRPAVLRHLFYSPIRMTSYQFFRSQMESYKGEELPLWKLLLCGATSGAFGQFVVSPADLLKVRMQADGRLVALGMPRRYSNSLFASFAKIVREEGFFGLWKGWFPNVQRACVTNLVEVPAYEYSRRIILRHGWMEEGTPLHVVCAMLCSFAACITSTPADVVKTRMMNQRSTEQLYRNSWHCLVTTVREEGFMALWKGFLPTYARFGPWSVTFWVVFEKLRSFRNNEAF